MKSILYNNEYYGSKQCSIDIWIYNYCSIFLKKYLFITRYNFVSINVKKLVYYYSHKTATLLKVVKSKMVYRH